MYKSKSIFPPQIQKPPVSKMKTRKKKILRMILTSPGIFSVTAVRIHALQGMIQLAVWCLSWNWTQINSCKCNRHSPWDGNNNLKKSSSKIDSDPVSGWILSVRPAQTQSILINKCTKIYKGGKQKKLNNWLQCSYSSLMLHCTRKLNLTAAAVYCAVPPSQLLGTECSECDFDNSVRKAERGEIS